MFGYMNSEQLVWLSVIAFIFLYCNLGSVCAHCLYNAATGWSRILGSRMRILAIALGVIGIIVAAGNVWAFFIQWLTLLGILVPPIGAIILVDQYLLRVNSEATAEWRVVPFIAWAAGSIVAFFVSEYAPEYSTAIAAFVVAAVVYGVLQSMMAPRTQYAR
jgi:cytosine permease